MSPKKAAEKSVSEFLERWEKSGASERANYQIFLSELCDVLDVPRPDPATDDAQQNRYTFDYPVKFNDGFNKVTTNYIDLYRREAFVLETKQGSEKKSGFDEAGLPIQRKLRKGTAVRETEGWNDAMLKAKGQAEQYARALPSEHGWPPFLVVIDIGHSIELYADFSRAGRTYVAFPDPASFRIKFRDLEKPEIRELLKQVWLEPLALDPTRRSAQVTREVAANLAELAKSLERSGYEAGQVAQFLMRCLFTMFAEDVGLLPAESFKNLLKSRRGDKLKSFKEMLESLWKAMDKGEFTPILDMKVLRFNGDLFKESEALPVNMQQLELLIVAAEADWKAVEPAIFGTLLERALDPHERHKLGAHYTPRAYVERLVMPTIIEPLREEWESVKAAAITLAKKKGTKDAREVVQAFLDKLVEIRVLDPACGSGNFLYVTLEHLKRLEGEIRDTLRSLGKRQSDFEGLGRTIDPHQFLGIEINPRAAAIAELVLWIGYLQWHFRTFGKTMPAEPIIRAFHNIECRDAILEWDSVEPVLDEDGKPVTRWDGRTTKTHPVTGEEVPDDSAQLPVQRYVSPRMAKWPDAEYIVGNPPFIGSKRMRSGLGAGYVDALHEAYSDLSESSDFVIYWWKRCGDLLSEKRIERFGLVTTNSLTMLFNRQVVDKYIAPAGPISLLFAIPDHPWVEGQNAAAVRICMTVCGYGEQQGILDSVADEDENFDESSEIKYRRTIGRINSKLSTGTDLKTALESKLKAADGMSYMGVIPVGKGFRLTNSDLNSLGLSESRLPEVVRHYLNGKDLAGHSRDSFIIDFCEHTQESAKRAFPALFQRVIDYVKPERDQSTDRKFKDQWWVFGRPRPEMRLALKGLPRYIATPETAKHRYFLFLDKLILPDQKIRVVADSDAFVLGALSSRIHCTWAIAAGARVGKGNDPVYNNTTCFEPFPFPICSESLKKRIREHGEQLDTHRKHQQALHPKLTLTDMYNVLEKLRSGEELTAKDKAIHEQGLVSVLRQIHDDLDAAVFEAYGWPSTLTDEEILERLVALNAERAEEEKRGLIRWLRPEFQNPSTGAKARNLELKEDEEDEEDEKPAKGKKKATKPEKTAKAVKVAKIAWPKTLPEQARGVRAALVAQVAPATPQVIAKCFSRAKVEDVEEILDTLVSLGQAREVGEDLFLAGN